MATAKLPRPLAGARPAINGLLMGLLSDAGLRRLDECFYDGEHVYRSDDWNEKGLFPWERQLLAEHFSDCRRVLVTACGGGREVLGLLEEGFDSEGYEPHPALAAYARGFLAERGHPARAHPSERDEFPPVAGQWDGVIVGWGSYSLVRGRARRIRFLAQAREHLRSGAPLLLSFFERPTHGLGLRWTRAMARGLRRLRRMEPVELGDTLAPNLVHVFTRPELIDEVTEAGFELATFGIVGEADGITSYAAAVVRSK